MTCDVELFTRIPDDFHLHNYSMWVPFIFTCQKLIQWGTAAISMVQILFLSKGEFLSVAVLILQ
jgi:hypothetical protein